MPPQKIILCENGWNQPLEPLVKRPSTPRQKDTDQNAPFHVR